MLLATNQVNALGRLLLPLGAGLIMVSSLWQTPARAQPTTFVIDASEGYGVVDCLVDGVACGRIVADAWCEAHSMGPAIAFGLASDITSAIPSEAKLANAPKFKPSDVLVTCGD